MRLKDLVGLLEKQHNWACKKAEGHYVCLMNVNEIQIQLIPNVVKCCDHFKVGLAPAVSLKEFSEAATFIDDDHSNNFIPLCINWARGERIVELTPAEIARLSDNAISWALSQDLEKCLTKYRDLLGSAVSIPVRHLVALALAGEVTRLRYYKRCFDRGDRLGFGLSISAKMIERAISIAQKVKRKNNTVQMLRARFLHPLHRRGGGSSAECGSAQPREALRLVYGHERLIMSYHTACGPVRMQRGFVA